MADATAKRNLIHGIGNGSAGARSEDSLSTFKIGDTSFASNVSLTVDVDAFAGSYYVHVLGTGSLAEQRATGADRERAHLANVATVQKLTRYLLANAMGLGVDDQGTASNRPTVPGIEEDCVGYRSLDSWAAAKSVTLTYDQSLALCSFTWHSRSVVIPLAANKVRVAGQDVDLGRFVIARGTKWFVPERELSEAIGP